MKKISIIILLTGLWLQNAYNQFTCEVITNGLKSSGIIPDYLNYIPTSSTPIKIIRVNFHFMLLEDSHPDAPGNFTPYDDGRGNVNFTAYDFVNDLLLLTNSRLDGNNQMTYPLGNSTPVISRKYRFVLNGVFFHKDNLRYWSNSSPMNIYSMNIGETINIFYQADPDSIISSGGYANLSGSRYSVFKDKWGVYNVCLENGINWGNWANAAGLMHETGHNLSLTLLCGVTFAASTSLNPRSIPALCSLDNSCHQSLCEAFESFTNLR